jgi:serine/threonine protein kinase
LHAQNFLHRDIAPDNIIVRADGTPVLLDFGAARRAVAEATCALTGVIKAGYSPHEQYTSNSRLQGPWSDLYALGGTLYRAVTGQAPEEATLRFGDDCMPSAVKGANGDYRPPFARRAGIRWFAHLVSLLTRQKLTDTTSGFQAVNARAIRLFAVDYPHDYPEVEAAVMVVRHKLRIMEVPARMRGRETGESSITALRSFYYAIKVTLALLVGIFRRRVVPLEEG